MTRTLLFDSTPTQDAGIASSFADQQAFLASQGLPLLPDEDAYLVSRLSEQCDGFYTATVGAKLQIVRQAVEADPSVIDVVVDAATKKTTEGHAEAVSE